MPRLPAGKRGKGMPQPRRLPPAPGPALDEDWAHEDSVGLASPRADPTPLPGLSAPAGAGPGLPGPSQLLTCQR